MASAAVLAIANSTPATAVVTAVPESTTSPTATSSPTTTPSGTPTPTDTPTDTPTATPTQSQSYVPLISAEMGMESQLAALGLPTGPVDGLVDGRTLRAVCAYRDLTGDTVSREIPDAVLMQRISTTTSIPLLPKRLKSVKALVSLTCQAAYITDEARTVIRVLPVSTGKDLGLHATRTGFKRVYYKLNRWQRSSLFPEPDGRPGLYRPIYFDRGIAFHGVRHPIKTRPQSHGCVRTWPKDQDWLFGQIQLRDRVFVYGNYWKSATASLGGYGRTTLVTPTPVQING